MRHEEFLVASLLEEADLTLERVAMACTVEHQWLLARVEEGLFPHARNVAGVWRLPGSSFARVRRMRQIERDFEAVPELAALVADLLEERDHLRVQLRSRAGGMKA
jgi:chaperone modulatory protein CbpM